MSEPVREIEVAGCFDDCPFYNGEWSSCRHPDKGGEDVNGGPGGLNELRADMEACGLEPYGKDYESVPPRPMWCPLKAGPTVVREKREVGL